MPQASEELRAKWHGPDDRYVLGYLDGRGYTLTKDWNWIAPPGVTPTVRDLSAIAFMTNEWDYGVLLKRELAECKGDRDSFQWAADRVKEEEARAERYRKALHALVEDMELVLSHDGLPESDALRAARDALGEG